MKIVITAVLSVLVAAEYKPCQTQDQFDVIMCQSFMCDKCTLAWCTEQCQATQRDYPTCRCKDWPDVRTSYSGGDFAGKGQVGDKGDYAKSESSDDGGDREGSGVVPGTGSGVMPLN